MRVLDWLGCWHSNKAMFPLAAFTAPYISWLGEAAVREHAVADARHRQKGKVSGRDGIGIIGNRGRGVVQSRTGWPTSGSEGRSGERPDQRVPNTRKPVLVPSVP